MSVQPPGVNVCECLQVCAAWITAAVRVSVCLVVQLSLHLPHSSRNLTVCAYHQIWHALHRLATVTTVIAFLCNVNTCVRKYVCVCVQLDAAWMAASAGVTTVIASGKEKDGVLQVTAGRKTKKNRHAVTAVHGCSLFIPLPLLSCRCCRQCH